MDCLWAEVLVPGYSILPLHRMPDKQEDGEDCFRRRTRDSGQKEREDDRLLGQYAKPELLPAVPPNVSAAQVGYEKRGQLVSSSMIDPNVSKTRDQPLLLFVCPVVHGRRLALHHPSPTSSQ